MEKNKRAARAARTLEREERTVNLELCIYFNGAPCVPSVAYSADIGEFEQGQRVKYLVAHEKKLNSMSQSNHVLFFMLYKHLT